MRSVFWIAAAVAAGVLGMAGQSATAAGVKITPLGSHDGEFCKFDRAMVFEDPNGTRILYDAGRTVAGPDDPRLGKIDVILVSHMHGDHIGDIHQPSPNAGDCGKPALSVKAAPNTNTVNIALAKNATIVTGSEMRTFLGRPVGESEDSYFGDFIEDDSVESPANTAGSEMLKERIEQVLKSLTYREREIIKLRYGIGDGYTYTLEEVGRIFKVTRERVRQVEAKAIRKLQHPVRSRKLEGFLDADGRLKHDIEL